MYYHSLDEMLNLQHRKTAHDHRDFRSQFRNAEHERIESIRSEGMCITQERTSTNAYWRIAIRGYVLFSLDSCNIQAGQNRM